MFDVKPRCFAYFRVNYYRATDGGLKGPVDDLNKGPEEGALLKLGLLILGLLEGDEDGSADQLGDPEGEFEALVDDWDEGPEEDALHKLGLLEGIVLG